MSNEHVIYEISFKSLITSKFEVQTAAVADDIILLFIPQDILHS